MIKKAGDWPYVYFSISTSTLLQGQEIVDSKKLRKLMHGLNFSFLEQCGLIMQIRLNRRKNEFTFHSVMKAEFRTICHLRIFCPETFFDI